MSQEMTLWVVLATVIGLTVFNIYWVSRQGGTLTAGEILQTAKDNYPLALQVKEVAEMAVFAAEELARTNDLPVPSDEKLKVAIGIFRKWIPLAEVDDITMIEAIKSTIPKINALTPAK